MQNCSIAKNNVVRSSNDRDVVMSNVNVDSSNVRSINDQNNVLSPDNQNQGLNNGRKSYASATAGLDDGPPLNPPPFDPARPHTLELFVPNNIRRSIKNLTRADYVNAVFRSLGTDAKRHVKCIQMGPTGYSCRVTFKDNAPRHQENLLAKGIHLRNNFLFFQEAQKSSFSVNVCNLPCEFSDEAVTRVFSKYGTIRKSIRVKDLDGLETGDRRLVMELRYHIPSRIPLGKYTAAIWYYGRPECCNHCNWWGHKIQECPLKGLCAHCGSRAHYSFACEEFTLITPYDLPVGERPDSSLVHPAVLAQEDMSSEHTGEIYDDFEDDEDDSWDRRSSSELNLLHPSPQVTEPSGSTEVDTSPTTVEGSRTVPEGTAESSDLPPSSDNVLPPSLGPGQETGPQDTAMDVTPAPSSPPVSSPDPLPSSQDSASDILSQTQKLFDTPSTATSQSKDSPPLREVSPRLSQPEATPSPNPVADGQTQLPLQDLPPGAHSGSPFSTFSSPSFCEVLDPQRRSRRSNIQPNVKAGRSRKHSRSPRTSNGKS